MVVLRNGGSRENPSKVLTPQLRLSTLSVSHQQECFPIDICLSESRILNPFLKTRKAQHVAVSASNFLSVHSSIGVLTVTHSFQLDKKLSLTCNAILGADWNAN